MSKTPNKTVHIFHADPSSSYSEERRDRELRCVAVITPQCHPDARDQSLAGTAYAHTQNFDGSWSLKIGHEAQDHLQVIGTTWSEQRNNFIGLRSTTFGFGDMIVIDGKRAYTNTEFGGEPDCIYDVDRGGFTAEAQATRDKLLKLHGISDADIESCVTQSQQPMQTPAITALAHMATAAAAVLAEQGITDGAEKAGEAITSVAMTHSQILQTLGKVDPLYSPHLVADLIKDAAGLPSRLPDPQRSFNKAYERFEQAEGMDPVVALTVDPNSMIAQTTEPKPSSAPGMR